MAKRDKRLKKGINSLKKEIENHFEKTEKDINYGNIDRGRYHIKEIEKSLLKALELKIKVLEIEDNSIDIYRKKLERLKKMIT